MKCNDQSLFVKPTVVYMTHCRPPDRTKHGP